MNWPLLVHNWRGQSSGGQVRNEFIEEIDEQGPEILITFDDDGATGGDEVDNRGRNLCPAVLSGAAAVSDGSLIIPGTECLPYSCSALESQNGNWDYYIFPATFDFDDVFPIDNITPRTTFGHVESTDWDSYHVPSEITFVDNVVDICSEPEDLWAPKIRRFGYWDVDDTSGVRVISAIVAGEGTVNANGPISTHYDLAFDLYSDYFQSPVLFQMRFGLSSNGGGFVDQGPSETSSDAIDISSGEAIEWVFSRLEFEIVGSGRAPNPNNNDIPYLYVDVRYRFDLANTNEDVVTLSGTHRYFPVPDSSEQYTIDSVEVRYIRTLGPQAGSSGEKRVAAFKLGGTEDYGQFADEWLSWRRNRSGYTPPDYCETLLESIENGNSENSLNATCNDYPVNGSTTVLIVSASSEGNLVSGTDYAIRTNDSQGLEFVDSAGTVIDMGITISGTTEIIYRVDGTTLTTYQADTTVPIVTAEIEPVSDGPITLDNIGGQYDLIAVFDNDTVNTPRLFESVTGVVTGTAVYPTLPTIDPEAAGVTLLKPDPENTTIAAVSVGDETLYDAGNLGAQGDMLVALPGDIVTENQPDSDGTLSLASRSKASFDTVRPFQGPVWRGVHDSFVGIEDFTFETWVYPQSGQQTIFSSQFFTPTQGKLWRYGGMTVTTVCNVANSTVPTMQIYVGQSISNAWAQKNNSLSSGSALFMSFTFDTDMIVEEWSHVAVCRDRGDRWYAFINGRKGRMVAEGDLLAPVLQVPEFNFMTLGSRIQPYDSNTKISTLSTPGYFDDTLWIEGHAAYTVDFEP